MSKVSSFFDDISENYTNKYSSNEPFLRWFFESRLQAACSSIKYRLNEPLRVIDVGCGTGALYDYLLNLNAIHLDYWGNDISGGMLEKSNIPPAKRIQGSLLEEAVKIPLNLDYVFMLGVTTYMNDKDISRCLEFLHKHMNPGGKFVVSFTNKSALNTIILRTVRPFLKFLKSKKQVAFQEFPLNFHSVRSAVELFSSHFEAKEKYYLNQSFFPFSKLFPNISLKFGKYLKHHVKNQHLLSLLSSDILIEFNRK